MSNAQLARDMQTEFQARFQAKQMRRQAKKAERNYTDMRNQIKALLTKGDFAAAREESEMLLNMQAMAGQMGRAARMAEVSAMQIQSSNSLNRMTVQMAAATRTMERAQHRRGAANPEVTLQVMEQMRAQTENQTMSQAIVRDAMSESARSNVPEEAVNDLLGQLADEAGVERSQALQQDVAPTGAVQQESPVLADAVASPKVAVPEGGALGEPSAEEEDALQQRLRALRG